MKMTKILFVGAHTDDIELFAGGLLAQKAKQKKAYCLTFSSHRGITNSVQASEEFWENMESLKSQACLLDFEACNGTFQKNRATIYSEIERALTKYSPDLVVTHSKFDTNQDHQQVYSECVRVCKGRVSLISGEYVFNQIDGDVPNVFVPLTFDEVETKVRLVQRYKSQYALHRKYFDDRVIKGLAAVRGGQVGTEWAEGYFLDRLIWTP